MLQQNCQIERSNLKKKRGERSQSLNAKFNVEKDYNKIPLITKKKSKDNSNFSLKYKKQKTKNITYKLTPQKYDSSDSVKSYINSNVDLVDLISHKKRKLSNVKLNDSSFNLNIESFRNSERFDKTQSKENYISKRTSSYLKEISDRVNNFTNKSINRNTKNSLNKNNSHNNEKKNNPKEEFKKYKVSRTKKLLEKYRKTIQDNLFKTSTYANQSKIADFSYFSNSEKTKTKNLNFYNNETLRLSSFKIEEKDETLKKDIKIQKINLKVNSDELNKRNEMGNVQNLKNKISNFNFEKLLISQNGNFLSIKNINKIDKKELSLNDKNTEYCKNIQEQKDSNYDTDSYSNQIKINLKNQLLENPTDKVSDDELIFYNNKRENRNNKAQRACKDFNFITTKKSKNQKPIEKINANLSQVTYFDKTLKKHIIKDNDCHNIENNNENSNKDEVLLQNGNLIELKNFDTFNKSEKVALCSDKSINQFAKGFNTFEFFKKNRDKSRILVKSRLIYDSFSDNEYVMENPNYVLSPNSTLLVILDFIILIISFYSILIIPFRLIFSSNPSSIIFYSEVIIDFIMLLDFFINFFTGFYDFEENYKSDFAAIFNYYFQSYFLIDIISLIPFNSIFEYQLLINRKYEISNYLNFQENIPSLLISNYRETFRILRLNRFFKLLKVFSYNKFISFLQINYFENFILPFSLKVWLLYLYFLIITHILTCVFIFLGTVDIPNWILNYNLQKYEFFDIYLASAYFNHLTIFTIGYGDIISKNSYERIYNILLMIFGVMLYSFVLSWISNMIIQDSEKTKKFESKKQYLSKISEKYSISYELHNKITTHLRHEDINFKNNTDKLYNDLPNSLKNELILYIYKNLINSFNFLKFSCNSDFTIQVLMVLKPTKFHKYDVILKEDDLIEEMFIIKNGILSLEKWIKFIYPADQDQENDNIVPNQEIKTLKIINLHRNDHFGDSLMIQNKRSPISLRVRSNYAELLLISKLELIKISTKFPEIYNKIYQKSQFNLSKIYKIIKRAEDFASSINSQEKLIGNKKRFKVPTMIEGMQSSKINSNFSVNFEKKFDSSLESQKINKIYKTNEIYTKNKNEMANIPKLNEINLEQEYNGNVRDKIFSSKELKENLINKNKRHSTSENVNYLYELSNINNNTHNDSNLENKTNKIFNFEFQLNTENNKEIFKNSDAMINLDSEISLDKTLNNNNNKLITSRNKINKENTNSNSKYNFSNNSCKINDEFNEHENINITNLILPIINPLAFHDRIIYNKTNSKESPNLIKNDCNNNENIDNQIDISYEINVNKDQDNININKNINNLNKTKTISKIDQNISTNLNIKKNHININNDDAIFQKEIETDNNEEILNKYNSNQLYYNDKELKHNDYTFEFEKFQQNKIESLPFKDFIESKAGDNSENKEKENKLHSYNKFCDFKQNLLDILLKNELSINEEANIQDLDFHSSKETNNIFGSLKIKNKLYLEKIISFLFELENEFLENLEIKNKFEFLNYKNITRKNSLENMQFITKNYSDCNTFNPINNYDNKKTIFENSLIDTKSNLSLTNKLDNNFDLDTTKTFNGDLNEFPLKIKNKKIKPSRRKTKKEWMKDELRVLVKNSNPFINFQEEEDNGFFFKIIEDQNNNLKKMIKKEEKHIIKKKTCLETIIDKSSIKNNKTQSLISKSATKNILNNCNLENTERIQYKNSFINVGKNKLTNLDPIIEVNNKNKIDSNNKNHENKNINPPQIKRNSNKKLQLESDFQNKHSNKKSDINNNLFKNNLFVYNENNSLQRLNDLIKNIENLSKI